MNSKILNHIKKVIVASAVIMLCSTNAAYGFTAVSNTEKNNLMRGFFNRFFVKEEKEYTLKNLQTELKLMKATGNVDLKQIEEAIGKLPEGADKDLLSGITDMFANLMEKLKSVDIAALLEKLLTTLLDAIGSLIGGIGDIGGIGSIGGLIGGSSSSLPVEAESIYMEAKTAAEFAGADQAVQLHANVYKHVDENGNEDSDKWALLIHPFMLDGTSIAGNVGPFYYEKGYNIIAPDLRGFGDSEGSVALGCFESMDIYDWLVKLNKEYEVSQVIVHGISLGAATTNYLSGIDGFINNGPTKIATKIRPIRELNVVGLVEDCGYVDMTEFASKSIVMSFSGLSEDTFDYYSKATNSLKYCDLPMLIIHGTSDTTVDPENAESVKNTVKGDVEVWLVSGGVHAFIIMGSNSEEYKENVHNFIDKVKVDKDINNKQDIKVETTIEEPVLKEETEKEESEIIKLIKRLLRR